MDNNYLQKPLLICRKCINDKRDVPWGFMTYRGFYNIYKEPKDMKCQECGNYLEKTKLNCGEYDELNKISHDQDFILSMIDLKEKDPIEYQLKLSQFKTAQVQQERVEDNNKPKCPYCNSSNLKRITTTAKAVNIAMFGLLGNKRKYQWHCNNCKSDF